MLSADARAGGMPPSEASVGVQGSPLLNSPSEEGPRGPALTRTEKQDSRCGRLVGAGAGHCTW